MRYIGIVLGTFFAKHNRIALLDRELGRIDGIVYNPMGSAGELLSYQIEHRGRRLYLSDVQVENSPLDLAREDILFLHHVLELCYVCMPIGSCTAGMFELLQKLYTCECIDSRQYKKIFMYQLLVLLGVMTSSYRMSAASLQHVHAIMQNISHELLPENSEKDLDMWLQHTICEYTDAAQLKTGYFLNLSRVT
jgi:hypothetical protein